MESIKIAALSLGSNSLKSTYWEESVEEPKKQKH
jgi:hypothetical protein